MSVPQNQEIFGAQLERLQSLQLPDGSWPYQRGASSGLAEPTCYALLALSAADLKPQRLDASLDWLESLRRKDKGYAPQHGVEFSNWTTSLVIQVMLRFGREDAGRAGIDWLLGLHGRETPLMFRAMRRVSNQPAPYPINFHGWPWLPDTASWLIPTSLAVLALQRAEAVNPSARQRDRIHQGQSMIEERRCDDGGWNHGAPSMLGVPGRSYPETTGIALLALQDVPEERIPGANALAASMLASTRIASTVTWLQLALAARGASMPEVPESEITCRNTSDIALRLITQMAVAGKHLFIAKESVNRSDRRNSGSEASA
jgi:hypothetical protein